MEFTPNLSLRMCPAARSSSTSTAAQYVNRFDPARVTMQIVFAAIPSTAIPLATRRFFYGGDRRGHLGKRPLCDRKPKSTRL